MACEERPCELVAKKERYFQKRAIVSEGAIGGSLVADRPNYHLPTIDQPLRSFQFGFNRWQLHHPLSFQFWLEHGRRALVGVVPVNFYPTTTIDCARATSTDLRRSAE